MPDILALIEVRLRHLELLISCYKKLVNMIPKIKDAAKSSRPGSAERPATAQHRPRPELSAEEKLARDAQIKTKLMSKKILSYKELIRLGKRQDLQTLGELTRRPEQISNSPVNQDGPISELGGDTERKRKMHELERELLIERLKIRQEKKKVVNPNVNPNSMNISKTANAHSPKVQGYQSKIGAVGRKHTGSTGKGGADPMLFMLNKVKRDMPTIESLQDDLMERKKNNPQRQAVDGTSLKRFDPRKVSILDQSGKSSSFFEESRTKHNDLTPLKHSKLTDNQSCKISSANISRFRKTEEIAADNEITGRKRTYNYSGSDSSDMEAGPEAIRREESRR